MFDPFFNPALPFTAMDLSDRSVKLARVQRKRSGAELIGAMSADIPEGLVTQGKVQDSKDLAKALKNILHSPQARKIASSAVAVALPEEHCFSRIIQVPKIARAELEAAIRWEAESAIPLPPGEAVISWQIIPSQPWVNHVDVLVAGAPLDLAESYLEVLRGIPLLSIAFEPESLSIVRALLGPEDKDGVLIIDFGREHTGVILTYEHSVRMTANIPISARVLTEKIADARKISLDEAEKLKRQQGIQKEGEGAALREILMPTLSDLAKQAQQFFGFFETHIHIDRSSASSASALALPPPPPPPSQEPPAESKAAEKPRLGEATSAEGKKGHSKSVKEEATKPSAAPDRTGELGNTVEAAPSQSGRVTPGVVAVPKITRVLLTGGDALLAGFPEYLTEAFGTPVVLGDPFRNIKKPGKNFERPPLFTTALGLALYPSDISSL